MIWMRDRWTIGLSWRAGIIIGVFGFVNLLMMAVGTGQGFDSALQDFVIGCEKQPQPCWNGIVPGITRVTTADLLLTQQAYRAIEDDTGALIYQQTRSLCTRVWLGAQDGVVIRIGMPVCQGVRLGSLSALFGDIQAVTQAGVILHGGQVLVGLPAKEGVCMDLTPYGWVTQIWLTTPIEARRAPATWRGPVSFQRYQSWYGIGCTPMLVYRPG